MKKLSSFAPRGEILVEVWRGGSHSCGSPVGPRIDSPSAAPRWMMKTKRRSVFARANAMRGSDSAATRRAARIEEESASEHDHLLTNSGLTSSKREALLRAFGAGDRGARRGRLSDPGSSFSASARASIDEPARVGEALRDLDPPHQRFGRGPACRDIVPTGRRAGLPGRLAELLEHRRGGRRVDAGLPRRARSAETDHSHGVLNFSGPAAHASGESISAR